MANFRQDDGIVDGTNAPEVTEENFRKYLFEQSQEQGRQFSQDEVQKMFGDYFGIPDMYAQMPSTGLMGGTDPYRQLRTNVEGIYNEYLSAIEKGGYDWQTTEDYKVQQEQDALLSSFGVEINNGSDTTTTYDPADAENQAAIMRSLREQEISTALLQGQQQAKYSELALDESQQKYGISGGLALAQESQRLAQVQQQQAPLYQELASLPYQEQLLAGEISQSQYQSSLENRSYELDVQQKEVGLQQMLEQMALFSGK